MSSQIATPTFYYVSLGLHICRGKPSFKAADRAVGTCAFYSIQDTRHHIKTSPLSWRLKFYTGSAAVDYTFWNMATSYHVTLPEIEALACMREEVALRNVEESTDRSHSHGDTRVNCGHLCCKYHDKITFMDRKYVVFRCCGLLYRHCVATVLEVRRFQYWRWY